jgi:hypothetical protein
MKRYFFKLTREYGSDLILECFDGKFQDVAGSAVGKRESVDIVRYLAILDPEFALPEAENDLIRAAGFGENNNIFTLLE